ncbi:hypothetical protein [Legionella sp. PC997]|uniref:hypothetical protein n=1 Tax=Legionella sp. PC997 TaxID=2755562 RepID=UPI00185FB5BF|nr:hypothetical protein [Legionella sp. PC997]QMT61639.1 hypothetical protein HBNCFIEN_03043 [Legionella sp. PC997]
MTNYTRPRTGTHNVQKGTMAETQNNEMLTAYFPDRDSAEAAYQSYLDRGYSPDDINIIMSEDSKKKYYDSDLVQNEETHAAEGLGVGGAIGAGLGALLGGLAAVGTSLAIPGLGIVIAGPIAAALAGAGAGSISGGIVGALIGWGIPEERAKEYERGIQSGGIVMSVKRRPNRDYSDLEKDWNAPIH